MIGLACSSFGWLETTNVCVCAASAASSSSPSDLLVWGPQGAEGPALYVTNTAMSNPGGSQSGCFYGTRNALLYGVSIPMRYPSE
jgi:hypothetical protein